MTMIMSVGDGFLIFDCLIYIGFDFIMILIALLSTIRGNRQQ